MDLERFLFEKGFKPDIYRTKVLAVCVYLIVHPTNNDLTLQQEAAMMLDTDVNNIAQNLYQVKIRYNKMYKNEMKDRTPLEVVYRLAYEYRDIIRGGR